MNPAKLRRDAARLREQASRILAEAKERAAMLYAEADLRQKTAERLEQLHPVRDYATIATKMEASTSSAPKKRRGPPLTSDGPISVAAKNSGQSMLQVANRLGESYDTVKSWNRRRKAPDRVRSALAKEPFSVPSSSWE